MTRYSQWTAIFILIPVIASSQIVINHFDGAVSEGTINWTQVEADPSYQELEDDSADAYEGAAALREYCYFGPLNTWGTFAHTGYNSPEPMDWSGSETLSVWIKVHAAPDLPDAFVFRMHLVDQPDGQPTEEYIYENTTIVDTEKDWTELVIPFVEREEDGDLPPNDEGFAIMPSSWGRPSENNLVLDMDRIVAYSLALVTTTEEEDDIELSFDYFTRSGTPDAVQEPAEIATGFGLSANYPNPFNPTTEIAFSLPRSGHVRLGVFNLMGQKVATLADQQLSAGPHRVQFHANNLPAGVYFYRLETERNVSTRKMILLP